ncbi:MAG: hypothetical protein ACUVRK_08810 [Spirochaetota bacterium]
MPTKNSRIAIYICTAYLIMTLNGYSVDKTDTLSPEEIKTLKSGSIIITKQKQKYSNGQIARVVGIILINKNVDAVWKGIIDWEAMPNYVDSLDYYHIISKIKQNISVIEGQIHVSFVKLRYTLLVANYKDTYYQSWRLITEQDIEQYNLTSTVKPTSSGIQNIEGYQYCIPYGDDSTILYYAPVVSVSVPVPGFVEDTLANTSIKDYLYGIKSYLEKGK